LHPRQLHARQGKLPLRLAPAVFAALLLGLLGTTILPAAGLEVTVSSGQRQSLVAKVVDAAGRPAAGAVVAFQLPPRAPSGVFANGQQTEIVVAGAEGQAEIRGIVWDPDTQTMAVRVNASFHGERAATVFEWKSPVALSALPGPSPPADTGATPAPGLGARSSIATAPDLEVPVYRGGSGWGKKLLIVAAVAGGAAIGGLVARGRSASAGPTSSAVTVTPTPGLTIGDPIITVVKP
jgi:hypothetical protein